MIWDPFWSELGGTSQFAFLNKSKDFFFHDKMAVLVVALAYSRQPISSLREAPSLVQSECGSKRFDGWLV